MHKYTMIDVKKAPKDSKLFASVLNKLHAKQMTTYIKHISNLKECVGNKTLNIPATFTERQKEYIHAYINRKYDLFTAQLITAISAVDAMLTLKEWSETSLNSMVAAANDLKSIVDNEYLLHDALFLQRYDRELFMDYVDNSCEDEYNKYEALHYNACFDDDDNLLPAPPSDDPVETDPQWADITDHVRSAALEQYVDKLLTIREISDYLQYYIENKIERIVYCADIVSRGFKIIIPDNYSHYNNAVLYNTDIIKYVRADDPIPAKYTVVSETE